MMHNIASLIDLTLLDIHATSEDIQQLTHKGALHHVAALCLYPQHLPFIPATTQTIATVMNFPNGNASHQHVLSSLEQLTAHCPIHEIDYVFPYQAYLAGDKKRALQYTYDVHQQCKQHNLLFKVIIETGALPSHDLVYQISRDVINTGCDFLKTSTGKIATGATLPAATAILKAIVDSKTSCGIKLSGGIKTLEQAQAFIQLAQNLMNKPVNNQWFRLGASGLLDLVIG